MSCLYDKAMLFWDCLLKNSSPARIQRRPAPPLALWAYAARLWTGAAVVSCEGIISLRRTLQIQCFDICLCFSARSLTRSLLIHLLLISYITGVCPLFLLFSLHTTAGPVDRDVVVGVARRPLRPLVLGQVVGLVLDAQGDAGGCQGEEGEAGVTGAGGAGLVSLCVFVVFLQVCML